MVQALVGRVGERIDGRYVLEMRIGVGGMGTVWRSIDELTGRRVAVKLLNPRFAAHAESARRFLREARLMRQIAHPNVVALHRFGPTESGSLVIDMEHIAGETVRERVVRIGEGVGIELGLRILDGILAGLSACHDAGVVHCDIKPENIMLVEGGVDGQVKIVDFGIAQGHGPIEQGEDFVILGTPAYMSPEQVRGTAVDARTDLYLVGAVCYELLTGEPPFVSDSPIELCQKQIFSEAPSLASRMHSQTLPDGLESWVASLMAKDADNRPRSARAARESLRQIRLRQRDASLPRPASTRPAANARRVHHVPIVSAARVPLAPTIATPRALRAIVEIRQIADGGTLYGPKALEEIACHLIGGSLADVRAMGAKVTGPDGAFIDIHLPCGDDERGTIHHLLDLLSQMQAEVGRIPEPRLEIRAAVLADSVDTPGWLQARPQQELATLLRIGPDSHVRIDERVARWAGRRPIVKLASVREAGGAGLTTLYATTLSAY